jgi:CheY-like chemotaxis protein
MGDPLRIRQVMMNLIGNAVKFTERGGVTVSMTASAHEKPAYSFVHITVSDTGIGIAPEKLESIFEKFAQGDTTITRKYGGTGLGLAISKSLAEIMDGSITAKSEYGKGAQFTLHLPLELANGHRMPPSKDNQSKMPQPQTVCGHVLLVEDYKPNVLVATHMIEGLGYVCDTAVNGEEALEKIRASRDKYSAVLMDIQMPDMDGFEATKIIREEEKAKNLVHLPIIAMTAYAMQGDKERCLAAGMDRYISKPFQPKELETILRECSDNIPAMEGAAES